MNDFDIDPTLDPELLIRLLSAGEPIEPPAEARSRMRETLLRRAGMHRPLPGEMVTSSDTPHSPPIADAVITVRPGEAPWKSIGSGLEICTLFRSESCRAILLRMHPGATLPAHDHDVDEECLVIEGEVLVDGLSMSKGTFQVAPRGVDHCEITTVSGALLYIKSGNLR